jgi:hypothetical protein
MWHFKSRGRKSQRPVEAAENFDVPPELRWCFISGKTGI